MPRPSKLNAAEKGKRQAIDKAVGAALRQIRLSKKVTQADLGRHLGVGFQQIQKYERGSNRLTASILYCIAEYLGVEIAQFYCHAGQPVETGAEEPRRYAQLLAPLPPGSETVDEEVLLKLLADFQTITDAKLRGTVLELVERLAAKPQ